ncbi:hypothetical protein [Paenibacillus illinoisensis]|uniref:hypothetical protein n=1 Tax=Paenibacillus illinoisensis TaxID=59845 RepID=UPI00203F732D|nr:hypothetical protein [Paenibacillus illinoisensis]MCM3206429.1 hypothetical protein [Paenibacillus illinoisensis]
MQELFTILFLVGFIAFFIFFILTVLAVRKKTGKAKLRSILTGVFLVMCCVGLYGIPIPVESPTNAGNEQSTVVDQEENQPPLFNMTTDEFKNAFNSIVGKYRLNDLGITKLDITESQETDTSTFNYNFTNELSMVGVLSPDKKIQEMMLIGTGGFGEKTGATLMTAMATLIMTSNSEYTYNDAQDVIKDMGLLNSDIDLNDFDGATVRNGYKYRYKIQDNNISTFGITAAK